MVRTDCVCFLPEHIDRTSGYTRESRQEFPNVVVDFSGSLLHGEYLVLGQWRSLHYSRMAIMCPCGWWEREQLRPLRVTGPTQGFPINMTISGVI